MPSMAGLGRFPGVDLPPRRRKPTHRHESYAKYREAPPLREWLEPSVNQVTSMDLDEATHKARSRLEKRLGYCRPSSRKDAAMGSNSKGLGRSWGFFSVISRNVTADREESRPWTSVVPISSTPIVFCHGFMPIQIALIVGPLFLNIQSSRNSHPVPDSRASCRAWLHHARPFCKDGFTCLVVSAILFHVLNNVQYLLVRFIVC
ncbi:RING/U-box superfamily protein [Prunus dulcis]|uniref:RING/U-box superfamily protein n=1 Tax=Prunus dulcis TaxID=3755 RepID=A0A4Y1QPK9_PRUDU|nr:RING/U-box superfamily protein [Prunus dulcis]